MVLNPIRRALYLFICLLSAVSLLSAYPAGAQEDPSWPQPGEPVPEQFAFSGEPPSLEEITEAFLKAYGGEPSFWPEELRHIHEVQVAFNKRALASPKFKGQFGQEALAKMTAQEKDPVGYWSRCLHDGWGFEEWFNHDHLTVQRVPRALLDRFMAEVFPLTWRDIRSVVHVKEFMLELSDKQFVPYNDYDSKVLDLRKRDVQMYNSMVEEAAERYIKDNDFLMLLLMSERIDSNWVGDESFEASLLEQAKRLSEKVQGVVSDMDRRFRSAFYRAFPGRTYSWNAEPWSEDHVVLNGKHRPSGNEHQDRTPLYRRKVHHPGAEGGLRPDAEASVGDGPVTLGRVRQGGRGGEGSSQVHDCQEAGRRVQGVHPFAVSGPSLRFRP
jgi:hypothetical protein